MITLAGEFDIFEPSFLSLLPKSVQDINCVDELGNIDNSPFAKNMNPDLSNTSANFTQRPPIVRFETSLDGVQVETCLSSGLCRKIPQIIKTRSYILQRCHG